MSLPITRAPTIVLVDDDAALRMALTFSLELDGFEVVAFSSAEDMMDSLLPAPPSCLVLDHNLTGITGLEALRRLRARAVDLPALLMTSHPPTHLREAAGALGATVVEKPLFGDTLATQVHAALAR
ncbi:MAG TPA: response regulator [Phenylobacterium sp.]|nr:response regulator [Phenylobacterium sp.]